MFDNSASLHRHCEVSSSTSQMLTIYKHPLISQAESSAVGCLCSNSAYFHFHLKSTKGEICPNFQKAMVINKNDAVTGYLGCKERNYNLTVDEVSDDYLCD